MDVIRIERHHRIDSRCAPRRNQHATNATSASSNGTVTNVNGSDAFTPNSSELIKRVSANEATKTNHDTESVSPIPFLNTRNRMLRGVAPSACRTPISFVCCVTKYASTP